MESDLSCLDSQEERGPHSDDVSSSHDEVNENDLKISSPIKRKKKVKVISPHHRDTDRENRNNNSSQLLKNKPASKKKRVHPRQYLKQVVQIKDSSSNNEFDRSSSILPQHLQLPVDQYEVTLIRRAVYKSTDQSPSNISPNHSIPPGDIGDTSLGMKLTILSGKVIVQSIVPLKDGRASPAQLTGMIQEGDVLLSIDGRLLVGLGMHLDLLIERLKPLSESINGLFSREIRIRFAVGHGLKLLHDAQRGSISLDSRDQRKQNVTDSKFHFSNYAMVDNLSGRQLFEDIDPQLDTTKENASHDSKDNEKNPASSLVNIGSDDLINSNRSVFGSKPILLSEFIATQISLLRQIETSQQRNGFFTLNETFSSLLRPSPVTSEQPSQVPMIREMHKRQPMDRNELLILTDAKALFHKAEHGPEEQENIDPLELVRSECQSFSSRSRFSTRYIKRLLQEDESTTSSSDQNSTNTSLSHGAVQGNDINYDEFDMQMNGDDMLLRLAVWNQKWKKSMVETLEAASLKTKETQEAETHVKDKKKNNLDIQLQNLMFGSEMTQLMQKKKSVALPPDEITEVLFELSNRICVTVPMSVNVNDSHDHSYSDEMDIELISSSREVVRRDKDIIEATRFLIDDILPKWLLTFKPIQPSQRSVLWPPSLDTSLMKSLDDDLSVESSATGHSSPERGLKLEDQVAHLELDADTKSETCHLVTFYFERKLIFDVKSSQSKMINHKSSNKQLELTENTAIAFIEKYGSYLKLYDAIIAAIETFSTKIINSLLELAKYDPSHINGMKSLSKNTSSEIIYETGLLSCILCKAEVTPFNDKSFDNIFPLVVKAYPDLKPWLLRARLSVFKNDVYGSINQENVHSLSLEENMIYYRYLSLLMRDHHMARMDATLVREWCVLSTHNVTVDGNIEIEPRLSNFFKVVKNEIESDVSLSDHLIIQSNNVYYRDLHFLLDTAVHIEKYDYALKIEEEIILDPRSSRNRLMFTLEHLQNMAIIMIDKLSSSHASTPAYILKHVILLMNKMSSHPQNKVDNPFMDLSEELLRLLDTSSPDYPEKCIMPLLTSIASPTALLAAMDSWEKNSRHKYPFEDLTNTLRKCLARGLSSDFDPNVSLSFHRVKIIQRRNQFQMRGTNLPSNHSNEATTFSRIDKLNIWKSLENGDLSCLDK